MTNADDQTPVPPVPPASTTPPAASPYAPSADAAPAYQAAPPTYTPGAPQDPYAPGVVGPPRGLSVTSMVLGIVGILFGGFGLFISIAAVITGHMGQRRQPYAKPFWLTGIITGYVGILIGLIVTAVIIFVIVLAATNPGGGYYYDS